MTLQELAAGLIEKFGPEITEGMIAAGKAMAAAKIGRDFAGLPDYMRQRNMAIIAAIENAPPGTERLVAEAVAAAIPKVPCTS